MLIMILVIPFYLGVELARAQIALQLYKNYNQDNELNWGTSLKKIKLIFLKGQN